MRQEGRYLGRAHVSWMSLAMEQNEAFNLSHISPFRAQAVVAQTHRLTKPVEQTGRAGRFSQYQSLVFLRLLVLVFQPLLWPRAVAQPVIPPDALPRAGEFKR